MFGILGEIIAAPIRIASAAEKITRGVLDAAAGNDVDMSRTNLDKLADGVAKTIEGG